MGGAGGGGKMFSAELGDLQALAAQEDHRSWSFPFKPPLVNVSVGCLLCHRDWFLGADEYSCWSGSAAF